MTEKDLNIKYIELDNINELNKETLDLLKEAEKASQNAYSAYSGFSVGAAVRCADGRIVRGNNQENAAYPSGLCAERVAIFSAVSQVPDTIITHLAVTVRTPGGTVTEPVAPCGACRQVIAEYEHRQGKRIEIIFSSESGKTFIVNGIDSLLPFTFNSDFLPGR